MEASERGHTEVVKFLLSKDADPTKVTTVSIIPSYLERLCTNEFCHCLHRFNMLMCIG